jgi:CheY-like chemotaxis protein
LAVLIVDPSENYRRAAFELIRWADRRHRVEFAESGSEAWKKALACRPNLVLCEPILPDITGAELCAGLRKHLRRSSFIIYVERGAHNTSPPGEFDGALEKPPSRVAMLSHLKEARERRRRLATGIETVNSLKHGQNGSELKNILQPVQICVTITDENMKFSLPVAAASNLATVLRRIGKHEISGFTLTRGGSEVSADMNTRLVHGDTLAIRLS